LEKTLILTDVTLLARDGRLEHAELIRAAMPREKVFEALRISGRQHLGQISRMYMEPSGNFSFIEARPARPGLSVLPAIDEELRTEQRVDGCSACMHCGNTANSSETQGESTFAGRPSGPML
jgi:uncharacterized membrane protein YcaP (DUF421 family)